jgi:hypothetical protein
VILKDKRRVYNTETAKLVLELANGFKGYRKRNGELFFELDGRIGICNIDYFHANACNQISDEEFYKCIGVPDPEDKDLISKIGENRINEIEKKAMEQGLTAQEIFNEVMNLKNLSK